MAKHPSEPTLSPEEFVELAVAQFPAVADDLLDDDWAGLITMQVACLTRYANDCLATRRLDEVGRLFRFFEQVAPRLDPATHNAYYVSFLEHLDLEGSAPDTLLARRLLSAEQSKAYEALRNWRNSR